MCPRVYTVGVCVCTVLLVGAARADIFSVDQGARNDPADLLSAGPTIHVPKVNLGLVAGDNVDALSQGLDVITENDIIYFSVDQNALGIVGPFTPLDVAGQAGLGQVAGDIFVTANSLGIQSAPVGLNYLDVNQHEFGLLPFGPGGFPLEPNVGEQENLDAYSMEEFDYTGDGMQDVSVYFSLTAGSPTLGGGLSPADILVASPVGVLSVAYTSTAAGLGPGDDIDALALEILGGGAEAYFSLAPGSPTLAAMGASPADVFYTPLTGAPPIVAYAAVTLGLDPADNLDALETNAIPEPTTILLLALAGLGVLRRRR